MGRKAGVAPGRPEQLVMVSVARLDQLVNEKGSPWDPSREDGLGGFPDGIANAPNLNPPPLVGESEDAVGGTDVSIPRDTGGCDVRNEQPSDPSPVGEVQMSKGAGGRVHALEVVPQVRLIQS